MKNLMKLIGIIALTAIIGFGFTACGGDDDDPPPDPLQGTWKWDDGASGTVTVNFTGNNYTFTATGGYSSYFNNKTGTFSISGSNITFSGDITDTGTFSVSGSNLTISANFTEGTDYVFVKQN